MLNSTPENKNNRILLKIITILFFAISIAVFLVCVLGENLSYAGKYNRPSNIVLLLIGILIYSFVLLVIFFIESKIKNKKLLYIRFATVSIIIWVIQTYMISQYYFHPGWDAGIVEAAVYSKIRDNIIGQGIIDYFSKYPNNMFITGVYYLIEKLLISFGLWSGYAYFAIICLNAFFCQIGAFLLLSCILKNSNRTEFAVLGYICYELLVGMSPWISIPYTDSTGLVFPILIFWLYLTDTNKRIWVYIKWIILGALIFYAYSLKPQACIVGIAILIHEVINRFSVKKELMRHIAMFALGFLLSYISVKGIVGVLDANIDEEKSLGPTHFYMMGLNEEYGGMWNEEDLAFSCSFDNAKERQKADIERAKDRIKYYGFYGLAEQRLKKVLTDYNDGSFAWWMEGGFTASGSNQSGTEVAGILKNLYYDTGEYIKQWRTVAQMLWIVLILFCPFAAVKNESSELTVLYLTYIGLLLFNILFEARARYLFTDVPIIILLAVTGMRNMIKLIEQKRFTIKKDDKSLS